MAEQQPEAELVEIDTDGQSGMSSGSLRLTVGPVSIEISTPVDEANPTAVLRAVQRSRCFVQALTPQFCREIPQGPGC